MSLLGIFGLLVGLLAFPVAIIQRTRLRVSIFALAYIAHASCGLLFYYYSLSNLSDSTGYYEDYWGFGEEGFGIGTKFIFFIVQGGRSIFGGTFLDYFLVFQAAGFFGIAILMRIFEEIWAELELEQPLYTYLILFIPGLHFWTSAIGKDALIFPGICLSLWAAMQIRKRFLWMGLGLLIVLLVRPHIALVMLAAVLATLLFDRASRFYTKAGLLIAAATGMVLAATSVQSTFMLDVTDAESVADFLARHDQATQTTDAGYSVVQGNFFEKLLSLLFRPLFFDAEGFFGYVASMENLILLIIILTLVLRFRSTFSVVSSLSVARYALVSTIGISVVITLVYYNVGLGLRQKMMFVPGILVMFVILLAFRRAREAHHRVADVGPRHLYEDGRRRSSSSLQPRGLAARGER